LRTPLATIKAATTDLYSRGETTSDAALELLDVVIDETERLDQLVANLLSMSRIEAGTLQPNFTSIDVGELVESSAHRVRRLFTKSTLHIDMPDYLQPVKGDYLQLEQVLVNLLENAVRHTPPGTAVRVSARATDDFIEIVVADNGPGIHRSERRGTATSGLGLVICSTFANANGGTMRIDDEPGGGTRITIRLVPFR
jgi:two-component system sensor histidine kinase KdpD